MSSEGGLFQRRELSTEQVDEFAQLMDKGHSAFDEEDFRLALDSYHRASVIDGSGAKAGIAARINVFGFAVAEIDYVRPFDRPGRGWLWQFSFRPGF